MLFESFIVKTKRTKTPVFAGLKKLGPSREHWI